MDWNTAYIVARTVFSVFAWGYFILVGLPEPLDRSPGSE